MIDLSKYYAKSKRLDSNYFWFGGGVKKIRKSMGNSFNINKYNDNRAYHIYYNFILIPSKVIKHLAGDL